MCVCLHRIDCHTAISIIWHTKKFNFVKLGVELKMNWLNWSIPISTDFQFQFNSNSKSFNSIPIQFMLNWIELIINSNSIHELIRALEEWQDKVSFCSLIRFNWRVPARVSFVLARTLGTRSHSGRLLTRYRPREARNSISKNPYRLSIEIFISIYIVCIDNLRQH